MFASLGMPISFAIFVAGIFVKINVISYGISVNKRAVDDNISAGHNVLLKLVKGRLVHNHQIGGVCYNGRAYRHVGHDNVAVCRTSAHFGTVGGEPRNLLSVNKTCVCRNLSGKQNSLSAESCE